MTINKLAQLEQLLDEALEAQSVSDTVSHIIEVALAKARELCEEHRQLLAKIEAEKLDAYYSKNT